jgi:acyl-CoA hydrolase
MAATIDTKEQLISFDPLPVNRSTQESTNLANGQLDEFGNVQEKFLTNVMDCMGGLSNYSYLKNPQDYILPTRSFDTVNFFHPIKSNDLIQFKAKTTRVWSSSIESKLTAARINPQTGELETVAEAFVTYAAMKGPRNEKGKIQLPPCYTESEEELKDYKAADLRRENRIQFDSNRKEVRELAYIPENMEQSFGYNNTTTIVFPVHINPFKITFGGHTIEWILESAKISAIKASKSLVTLKTIKSLQFILPSANADLLMTKSIVSGIDKNENTIEIYTTMYKRNRENMNLILISDAFTLFEINNPAELNIQPSTDLQHLLFNSFDNRWD